LHRIPDADRGCGGNNNQSERRDAAIAVSAPVPEVSIPPSLVPGGETTIKAVTALRRPWLFFDLVREIGLNPDDLPPRDRQRYWYAAIVAARVDAFDVRALGDAYAKLVAPLGFIVGPAPGG